MSGDDAGAGDDPRIRALDEATVQRIAAGEVVERPASAVKELVENSLDADASRISVAVEDGGKAGVRVRDDGVGMTEAELDLAVEEHTTSKIADLGDLEAGVSTLGFRGEALSTIGAVSRLTVRSRPRDSGAAGAEITVEGDEKSPVRPVGCPEGTTVEVEELFFNTPARKKFLKTDATEFDHVNTVVTQYALANPDVAVSLEHNGREVFATEGNGDLQSAVLSVYGREVAESMVEVRLPETGSDGEPAEERKGLDGPVASVTGLVSHPETTRSGREYLSTFVNDRYVTASVLREAVLDAYGGQLASDRYPFAVLFVEVPPDVVDVNVHPRKMEVRFDDDAGVKRVVRDAVEEALLDHGLVRSTAPRGRSAPDETAVEPENAEHEVVGGAGTAHEDASDVTADRSRRERTPTRVDSDDGDGSDAAESTASTTDPVPSTTESDVDAWSVETDAGEVDDVGEADDEDVDRRAAWDNWVAQDSAEGTADDGETTPGTGPAPDADATDESIHSDASGAESVDARGSAEADETAAPVPPSPRSWQADPETDDGDGREATASETDPARGFTPPTTQRTLGGDDVDAAAEFDNLPRMRVLGQLHDTYIVAETLDGLVLVDQHAADERVNYERLQREVRGDATAQALADPVELELTAREAALFAEYDEALSRVGFRAERVDERAVEVQAVPAVFDAALDPGLLRDALTAFVSEGDDGGRETVDAVVDDLLADLACYPSITGNTSLTEGSVVDLLATLDGCENPYACPHGRPVVIRVDSDEIADRFERDYPGHGGRRRE